MEISGCLPKAHVGSGGGLFLDLVSKASGVFIICYMAQYPALPFSQSIAMAILIMIKDHFQVRNSIKYYFKGVFYFMDPS